MDPGEQPADPSIAISGNSVAATQSQRLKLAMRHGNLNCPIALPLWLHSHSASLYCLFVCPSLTQITLPCGWEMDEWNNVVCLVIESERERESMGL
jgi:hypothetical protein